MLSDPPRTLYTLDGHDARLIEYDLRYMKSHINAAVHEAVPRLEVRPPLPDMYGKPARMNRSVAFFADPEQTYGYFYSKQLSKSQPPTEAIRSLMNIVINTHAH